jgi:hypothetical protein
VEESKVKPEIVDVRVKCKGLVTYSLILNSFSDTISSAYDIQRLTAGLLNKDLMSASETGNEKFESGKIHFKNQTTEFVKYCSLNIKVYCKRDSAVITTGSGNLTLKRAKSRAKGEYLTFQEVTGTERSRCGLQVLLRINCALQWRTKTNTMLRHRS